MPVRAGVFKTICGEGYFLRSRTATAADRLKIRRKGSTRSAKGPGQFAELRGQDSRAVPAGPPFHPFQKALERPEQCGARPRDATAYKDRFRVKNIDKGTDRGGERLHRLQPDRAGLGVAPQMGS